MESQSEWRRLLPVESVGRAVVIVQPAEAAIAFLEIGDGAEQMRSAKVGPQRVGDEDLGISDLPEQKVAKPKLAAGTDDQIGGGKMAGVKVFADGPFVARLLAQGRHGS